MPGAVTMGSLVRSAEWLDRNHEHEDATEPAADLLALFFCPENSSGPTAVALIVLKTQCYCGEGSLHEEACLFRNLPFGQNCTSLGSSWWSSSSIIRRLCSIYRCTIEMDYLSCHGVEKSPTIPSRAVLRKIRVTTLPTRQREGRPENLASSLASSPLHLNPLHMPIQSFNPPPIGHNGFTATMRLRLLGTASALQSWISTTRRG